MWKASELEDCISQNMAQHRVEYYNMYNDYIETGSLQILDSPLQTEDQRSCYITDTLEIVLAYTYNMMVEIRVVMCLLSRSRTFQQIREIPGNPILWTSMFIMAYDLYYLVISEVRWSRKFIRPRLFVSIHVDGHFKECKSKRLYRLTDVPK